MKLIGDGGIVSCNTPDTIDAIMLTKNLDFVDGVKIDVRKTKDNVLVLSKYDELNKFTLCNKKISQCNYDYLRKVKFPSHIFKYYIPTLSEVLDKYDKKKMIIIELYNDDDQNSLINELYYIIKKYSYNYYFISENKDILKKLIDYNFDEIGTIIDDNSNVKIIRNLSLDDDITLNDDIILITEYPEKIRKIM